MARNGERSHDRQNWLVIGHGSVGSFLAARIARAGHAVHIVDPNPRVPLSDGLQTVALDRLPERLDHVASCVPPDAAGAVAKATSASLRPDAFFFDWNTLSPAMKIQIRDSVPATVIDVALLDSLDTAVARPTLAVSGPRAGEAATALRRIGFAVAIAGDDVGEAAALKYLRSIFMKSLEALVLEHASLSFGLDDHSIVRRSIANNLGDKFADFMDLLMQTNRVHAERRSLELADAVAMFIDEGARPELAAAGVDVLRRSAEAWRDPSAPPPGSDPAELARYLHDSLWPQPAST